MHTKVIRVTDLDKHSIQGRKAVFDLYMRYLTHCAKVLTFLHQEAQGIDQAGAVRHFVLAPFHHRRSRIDLLLFVEPLTV